MIKRQIIDWLQPLEGRQVLDVGCGTGDDSREIARLFGPRGRVMAIYFSAAMIIEARQRNTDSACRLSFVKVMRRNSTSQTDRLIARELNVF
jgi:ubiquinone/menaquinone biosynthesis C-methylase UbiE